MEQLVLTPGFLRLPHAELRDSASRNATEPAEMRSELDGVTHGEVFQHCC